MELWDWAKWAAAAESAEAAFRAMKTYLVGHDPARLEEMRFLIANPTASLYNNRTQNSGGAGVLPAWNILGQAWGVPVKRNFGRAPAHSVRFAAYSFFRYPNPRTGEGEVRTVEQVVENIGCLKRAVRIHYAQGEGGSLPSRLRTGSLPAVAAAFPEDSLRFDPNAVWSTEQAIRFGQAIESLRNDYLEDPVYGLSGMRRTRQMIRVPLATNTVVVNFEQIGRECPRHRRRRDFAGHNFLGRHPRVRQGGRCLRDFPAWRGRTLIPANWEFNSPPCCISAP